MTSKNDLTDESSLSYIEFELFGVWINSTQLEVIKVSWHTHRFTVKIKTLFASTFFRPQTGIPPERYFFALTRPMPRPLTKRKGQAKHKASESTPRPSKKATTPKSMSQPAPSVRTNAFSEVIVISVDDASDDDKPPPKSTADVSHTIFTISRYIVLNKDPVLEDADKYAENHQSYTPEG